jgi:hypothetical protein
MLGKDRAEQAEAIVKALSADHETKEQKAIIQIVAAPRQGKTLMLDLICAKLLEGNVSVCITYNSCSPLSGEAIKEISDVTAEFWGRVILQIVYAMRRRPKTKPKRKPKKETNLAVKKEEGLTFLWQKLREATFFRTLSHRHAYSLVEAIRSEKQGAELIIAADEFSEVVRQMQAENWSEDKRKAAISTITPYCRLAVTGFSVQDSRALSSISGRPTLSFPMAPATKSQRDDYKQLRQAIAKCFKRAPFPIQLYELVKFSPGLLGLWLEELGNRRYITNFKDLQPPVVLSLNGQTSELLNSYFAHVANSATHEKRQDISTMIEHQARGLMIISKVAQGIGFLNPFLLMHAMNRLPAVVQPALEAALHALQPSDKQAQWNNHEKGKALEKIVAASLVLRCHYSKPCSLSELLQRLFSGPPHPGDMTVTLGRGEAVHVDAFPDHSCSNGESFANRPKPTAEQISCRIKENWAALCSGAGVVVPKAWFSSGCGLITIGTLHDGSLVLIAVELRYHNLDKNSTSKDLPKKAQLVFKNMLHYVEEGRQNSTEGRRRIAHVAFVYCTTAETRVAEPPCTAAKDEREALHKLNCTTSIHLVRGQDEGAWRGLLMESLYYVLPDLDERQTTRRRRQATRRRRYTTRRRRQATRSRF